MSISFEEVIKAVDYACDSPFVKKIQGDRYSDEEMNIAQKIYESSAMLGSVKKEHENVLSVLSEASKNQEQYDNAFIEYMNKEKAELTERAEKAQKEFEAIPKRDEAFIASCEHELKIINSLKQAKEKEIRSKFEERFDYDKKKRKYILILAPFAIAFGIVSLFAVKNIDIYSSGGKILGYIFFAAIFLGGIFLITAPFALFFKPKPASETVVQKDIDKAMPEFERAADKVNAKMEVGYDPKSEFYRALISAEMELEKELYITKALADRNYDILTMWENGFQDGIYLLQKAMDNFDSLSVWAANYLRDQAQKEHNAKMLSIEEEKLRAQEAANQAQAYAIQQQNELLERQARAAEQQARDTGEMRTRMEKERYGEVWRDFKN